MILGPTSSATNSLQRASPLTNGRRRSRITTSKSVRLSRSRASAPSYATHTEWPRRRSPRASASATSRSSSTTSTRAKSPPAVPAEQSSMAGFRRAGMFGTRHRQRGPRHRRALACAAMSDRSSLDHPTTHADTHPPMAGIEHTPEREGIHENEGPLGRLPNGPSSHSTAVRKRASTPPNGTLTTRPSRRRPAARVCGRTERVCWSIVVLSNKHPRHPSPLQPSARGMLTGRTTRTPHHRGQPCLHLRRHEPGDVALKRRASGLAVKR